MVKWLYIKIYQILSLRTKLNTFLVSKYVRYLTIATQI